MLAIYNLFCFQIYTFNDSASDYCVTHILMHKFISTFFPLKYIVLLRYTFHKVYLIPLSFLYIDNLLLN